jgi:hypothetical protein
MKIPKLMCCGLCGHKQTLTISDAKTMGWKLWVGGGWCPQCAPIKAAK